MRHTLMIAVLLAGAGPGLTLTLTGDVPTDFVASNFAEVIDYGGVPDVGVPIQAPPGTVSGFDFERILFVLDVTADELVVGIDYFGIAGDADGDGGEGTTSPWLAGNGGIDMPNLGGSESICMAFDFDLDDTFDLVAGVDSWDDVYTVAQYQPHVFGINFSFGTDLPAHEGPHAIGPDFEFVLSAISQLATIDQNTICFKYAVFSGSIQDDGVGEDLIDDQVGLICVTDDELVEALLPRSMDLVSAYPNPFNPTTTLQLELAETGQAALHIYNLQGQRVSTLVDGMMEAGRHELSFNGANLSSGLYLAQLTTERGVHVERLLLTK